MTGVLDSGADAILEVSAEYIRRVVWELWSQSEPFCYSGDLLTGATVEGLVPDLVDAWVGEEGGGVVLHYAFRATYGSYVEGEDQIRRPIPPTDRFTSSPRPPYNFPPTFPPLALSVSVIDGNLAITISSSTLGIRLPDATLSLDAFSQRRLVTGPLGTPLRVNMLGVSVRAAAAKAINYNLVVGFDIEMRQDSNLNDYRDQLGPFCNTDFNGPVDLDHFRRSLQPSILSATDQWALALDYPTVFSLVAATSSITIPARGGDCDRRAGLTEIPCFLVLAVHEGYMRAVAQGRYFHCSEGLLGLFTSSGWWSFDLYVNATLRWDPAQGAILVYQETGRSSTGGIPTSIFDRARSGDHAFPLPRHLETPQLGRLTVQRASLHEGYMLLAGSGSLSPLLQDGHLEYRIDGRWIPVQESVPVHVHFARPCDSGGASERTIEVRRVGPRRLRSCPIVIRGLDAHRYTVMEPQELMAGGVGLRGDAAVVIGLTPPEGEPIGDPTTIWRNQAEFDFPNDVQTLRFAASGNLGEPVLTLDEGGEISRVQVDYVGRCGQMPAARPFVITIPVRNTGIGTLKICDFGPTAGQMEYNRLFDDLTDYPLFLPSGESGEIVLRCHHLEYGTEREVRLQAAFRDNCSGTTFLSLTIRRDLRADLQGPALSAGIEDDLTEIICAQIDWSSMTDGVFADGALLDELADLLSGNPCCPPPHGPLCLCVDMIDVGLRDLERPAVLQAIGSQGEVLAESVSSTEPRLLIPHSEGVGMIRVEESLFTGVSHVLLSRLSLERTASYASDQKYASLAARNDLVYGAGPKGLDVVRYLSGGELQHLARIADRADSVVATSQHLFMSAGTHVFQIDKDKLNEVYSVDAPLNFMAALKPVAREVLGLVSARSIKVMGVDHKLVPLYTLEFESDVQDVASVTSHSYVLLADRILSLDVETGAMIGQVHTNDSRITPRRLLLMATRLVVVDGHGGAEFFTMHESGILEAEGRWHTSEILLVAMGSRTSGLLEGEFAVMSRPDDSGFDLVRARVRTAERKYVETRRERL